MPKRHALPALAIMSVNDPLDRPQLSSRPPREPAMLPLTRRGQGLAAPCIRRGPTAAVPIEEGAFMRNVRWLNLRPVSRWLKALLTAAFAAMLLSTPSPAETASLDELISAVV